MDKSSFAVGLGRGLKALEAAAEKKVAREAAEKAAKAAKVAADKAAAGKAAKAPAGKAAPAAKATTPAAKVPARARAPSAYHTPRQIIAGEYSRDIAQRLEGIIPADAPISEWREAAERLSSPEVAKPNARLVPEFNRPGNEPLVSQVGRQGLPVRGMDLTEAQHPSKFGVFSSYKTPTDPLETEVVTSRYANMPDQRRFDTNRLENAKIVSLLADKERAGDTILSVNGLPTSVNTQGGPMHAALQEALGGTAAFSSEFGALGAVRRAIREGLDAGQDVFGVTTTMGPGSLNQTTDMTDLLHQMAKSSPVREADVRSFDERVRLLFPEYAGLLDEDAARQMHALTQGQRKAFVGLLDNADALKQGLPSVPAARFSLTDPNLVDVPAGATGYSYVKLGPESLGFGDSPIRHSAYPDDMTGTFEGRGPLVPFSTMFSDATKARRGLSLPAGSDLRSLELRKPSQNMTPEAFDLFNKYLSGIDDPY